MNELTDQQLLRNYADSHSENAFAALVKRHVDFVYSSALRMVRDAQLAEDVTQSVFLVLADNAEKLAQHPVLPGWLHRTTQNLAANAVRADMRRRAREQEAVTMNELLSNEPDATWEQIAPHLDSAIGELSDADRHAVLLRYFQRKSAREIAEILGLSDDAAQKRVSRAVERLRDYFSKNGIAVGSGGIVTLLSVNAVQSAPIGLSAMISTAAITSGTVSAATMIDAGKTLIMTTTQKVLVTTALAAALGTGVYEWAQNSRLQNKVQQMEQKLKPLAEQNEQLRRERDEMQKQLLSAQQDAEQWKRQIAELPKLRGEVARLRGAPGQTNDPTQTAAKAWANRVGQLKDRLKQHPDASIPELDLLDEDDWLAAVKGRDLVSDNDYRLALSTLRNLGENRFGYLAKAALQKFLGDNERKFPADMTQLREFFNPPVSDEILERWQILPKKTFPNFGVGDWIITEKAPVDEVLDSRIVIGEYGTGSTDFLSSTTSEVLKAVYKSYVAENKSEPEAGDYSQLLPYARTPEQKAAIQKMIEQQALRK